MNVNCMYVSPAASAPSSCCCLGQKILLLLSSTGACFIMIKEVSSEVKASKLAGDKDEVARLGKEKEQLRQKEQSLREELLLLLKAA